LWLLRFLWTYAAIRELLDVDCNNGFCLGFEQCELTLFRVRFLSTGGFMPGGASLHACMTPHGPDTQTFETAIADDQESPAEIKGSLAFM
jgi:hypothetical protein